MKRWVLMIVPVLICGMVFTSCGSDTFTSGIGKEGVFSGTITVTYLSSNSIRPNRSDTIKIKLKNGEYSMIDFLHEQADISGNYIISNGKIIFKNTTWKTDYVDNNGIILAYNFDTFVVPQGECNYTFDGNKLKLSKVYDDFAYYEWNLKKQ